MLAYSDKLGVVVSILWLAAVSERGVFPIQVQAVEAVLSQKPDGRLDELPPAGGVGHHGTEALGALVPAADGEEGLQVLVVSLQTGKLTVAA